MRLLVVGAMISAPVAHAGDPIIEVIAAPYAPFGTTLTAFTTARINASGQVQFVARIVDTPNPVYSAIYVGVPGSLTMIAREGPFIVGTDYIYDLEFGIAPISDTGNVLMYYGVAGPGIDASNDRVIGVNSNACAQEEGTAPGTGGLLFDSFPSYLPRINNVDGVAFKGELIGEPLETNHGFWYCSPTVDELIIREGDAAAGMPAGVVFSVFDTVSGINDSAEIVFRGRVSGTGIDSTNDHGIWLGAAGALQLVAREGDLAPDIPGDVFFGNPDSMPTLNNAGEVAFTTLLTGEGVTSDNIRALMTGTVGNLIVAARTGDPAPGAGGAVFSFLDAPVIDAAGRLAFRGELTGAGVDSTNDEGIWTGFPGALTLVARTGSAPPEADAGDVFSLLNRPVINGLGQVAFHGRVLNGATTLKRIWATDAGGVLTEVIREGDTIDLGGGDMRTVKSPELEHRGNFGGGGQDGRPRCLNDAGQLAFDTTFVDNTKAIIRATIGGGPTPCPADVSGDDTVDVVDLLAVLGAWGPCDAPCPPTCVEDTNDDCTVDVVDLLAVLGAWGSCGG